MVLYRLFCIIFIQSVSSAKYCGNIPPFLSRLRTGVDITKLDLLPLRSGSNDGFRYPVIHFTCDIGRTMILNGIEYSIPDQVDNIVPIPSGWMDSDVKIHKSIKSVKESMASSLSIEYGNILGTGSLFSQSSSVEIFDEYLTKSSKYIEEKRSYISSYKVSMTPHWEMKLGQVVNNYIQRFLPHEINNNTVEKYMKFIETFGTHYFSKGTFGGLLRLLLVTDKGYFHHKTETVIKSEISALFGLIKSSSSSRTVKIDAEFSHVTKQNVRYYGGHTNLLVNGGINAWQPTVISDPWLFGGRLSEIYGMIKNPTTRKSMKIAVQIYTDKAYLKELLRTIKWYYVSVKWNRHRTILSKYEDEVNYLLHQPMPNQDQMKELHEVTNFVQRLHDQLS